MPQQRLFFSLWMKPDSVVPCGSYYNNLTLALWPKPNCSILRGNSHYLNAFSPTIHFGAIKEH